MGRFQRSWELFKSSIRVIAENKKLLLFPMIISLFLFIIVLFFVVPIAVFATGYAGSDPAHWRALEGYVFSKDSTGHGHANPLAYVVFIAVYLVAMFFSTFFNVAFFNEILNALNGKPVSIIGGLKFATSRLKAIFAWSLFAGAVGIVIKMLEERVGLIGKIVLKLVGVAWSVACVFVIPVIVREGTHANPVEYLKSSAGIIRKTWGESLIGYAGLQFGGLIVVLGSFVMLGTSFALGIALNNGLIIGIGAGLWLISLFVFMYLMHVASQVYRGALYIYATEGVIAGPFEQDQMELAWKAKKN